MWTARHENGENTVMQQRYEIQSEQQYFEILTTIERSVKNTYIIDFKTVLIKYKHNSGDRK